MLKGIGIGILIATASIIAAEIAFKYSLGDKVADLFRSIEGKAEAARLAVERANARLIKAMSKLRADL